MHPTKLVEIIEQTLHQVSIWFILCSLYRRCDDITCLQKNPKGQTTPGTRCALVYYKKHKILCFKISSRKLLIVFFSKVLILHLKTYSSEKKWMLCGEVQNVQTLHTDTYT